MKKYICSCLAALLIFLSFVGVGDVSAQTYNYYYGNLHAHSSYSDGNQDSATSGFVRPRQNYAYADASMHMDFLGISDHNHGGAGMRLRSYAKGLAEADSATNANFVALYGMEWGIIANGGHMLVYGVDSLIGWEAGNHHIYVDRFDYSKLYREINKRPGAFALFAHPTSGDYNDLTTVAAAYNPSADSAVVGSPLRSGPATSTSENYDDTPSTSFESTYNRMLAKGYRMGISYDHDNHNTTFGRTTPGRLVVLAPSLTKVNILAALRAMRFFASDDWNAEITLTLNGAPMGSITEGATDAQISVTVSDGDLEAVRSITLMRGTPGSGVNSTAVATAQAGLSSITFTDTVGRGNTRYYHVIVVQADGDRIVSSPVWYTRERLTANTSVSVPPRLEVFPNPVEKGTPVSITFFNDQDIPPTLSVSDGLGKVVTRLDTQNRAYYGADGMRLETQNLPTGMYIVCLQQGQKRVYKKLVIE